MVNTPERPYHHPRFCGPLLRRLRVAYDIPQARLAASMGIHASQLSLIERGECDFGCAAYETAYSHLGILVETRDAAAKELEKENPIWVIGEELAVRDDDRKRWASIA